MSSWCDRAERDPVAREPKGKPGSSLPADVMVIVVSGPRRASARRLWRSHWRASSASPSSAWTRSFRSWRGQS